MHRIATPFILLGVLLCPLLALAQQPVQALGSGVQNTSDAAWTSSTGGNTAVQFIAGVTKYNTVLVTLVQGTTITGGVVTFEQSIDNSTFTPVQGVTLGTTAIMGPTYTLTASTNVSFLFPVNAPYFQIRLSTVITGSGTVTVQHATQSLPVAALLAGTETLATGSNVIGAVTQSGTWNSRTQDGAGNALTSNSTTYTAKFGLDSNLLGTLGTAFSTAGKVDVKGADGDVFVRQTTGSNLHVVNDANATVIIGETVPVASATTTDTTLRCVLVSAASTNATNCKNASGNVYGFRFINTTATL